MTSKKIEIFLVFSDKGKFTTRLKTLQTGS